MTLPLRFVSEAILVDLHSKIDANLQLYASGDFAALAAQNGWSIESKLVQVDVTSLATLDGTSRSAEADVANSRLVHKALSGMTPAIAADERIWVRLAHVECLPYSRARWLSGFEGDKLIDKVDKHMFARGRTGVRDDNAISRLWWNMHIASIADPQDPDAALELIVKRADIRMQFVERPGSAARRPVAQAVVRGMRRDPWIVSSEDAFRKFMIELNRNGGGVLFEALDESKIDGMVDSWTLSARKRLA